MLKIGKGVISVEANKDMTEKEFKKKFGGKIGTDIDAAWKSFQKEAKKLKKSKS
jgi:hypothetical protein